MDHTKCFVGTKSRGKNTGEEKIMAYIFVYTKQGSEFYSDINNAMYIALSRDGKKFIPLRNNTGVLFPKAMFDEGKPEGVTKTMMYPWIFHMKNHAFGVCCIRYNKKAPDSTKMGCIMLFTSIDLIQYEEMGYLKVADEEIKSPHCSWDINKEAYYLEWETRSGIYCGYTSDFNRVTEISKCFSFKYTITENIGISGAVPGNMLEITDEIADMMETRLGVIYNTGIRPITINVPLGQKLTAENLPKATCKYSDGSIHDKEVCWDSEAIQKIDFNKSGEYKVHGDVVQKWYDFPVIQDELSDPYMTFYKGKYYLMGTGRKSISFRVGDTIENTLNAKPIDIYKIPQSDIVHENLWAPELHIIRGIPYIFTTVGKKEWYTVRCHVLRCNGDPSNPKDWGNPRLVIKPDGTELNEAGISLDMTYFCVDEIHYVMWSNRIIHNNNSNVPICETANLYIATINPDEPWRLTSKPVCICRPEYGWNRLHQEVVEGPYCLQRGDDLFVSISGSSTGKPELYCVGLLHTKRNCNLLSAEAWKLVPYPLLTKESVVGEYGPGHNNFIKDLENGDDIMVYHAIAHAKDKINTAKRQMGLRRVHWGVSGYPYLELTRERDLAPQYKRIYMTIKVLH